MIGFLVWLLISLPSRWIAWPLALAEGSAAMLKRLPGLRTRGQENENKIHAYSRFRLADRWLGDDLERSVAQVASIDPYDRLWTLEGLAWAAGERSWSSGPRGMLARVPPALAPALHAGLGMSFANRSLAEAGSMTSRIDRYFDLCRANALPGWDRAMVDALGLVAQTARPDLLGEIDKELARRDPGLVPYYWHGVGRSLYFASTAAPRPEPARLDTIRGLAWAVALVNVRHPELVETSSRRPRDDAGKAAWNEGVAHALLLYRSVIGRPAPGFERWPEAPGPVRPEMYRRNHPETSP